MAVNVALMLKKAGRAMKGKGPNGVLAPNIGPKFSRLRMRNGFSGSARRPVRARRARAAARRKNGRKRAR